MARGVHFELIGLSDLTRSLDSLRDGVKAQLADALDDTAQAIQVRARINVPRDTSDLARAIQVGGRGLSRRVGLDDAAVGSRGGDTAHQHPWVYGMFVEFGLRVKHFAAHPFMGPAVDAETPQHNARVEKALNAAVERV